MYFKEDFEKAKQRILAFWEREVIDRPCISVIAPKQAGGHISMFHNPKVDNGDEQARLDYWTNPETILQNNLNRLESTHHGGEALPLVFLNFGTSGTCNYFGAKPAYGHDTIWFEPVAKSIEEAAAEPFDEAMLAKHLKIAEFLAKNSDDKFFVAMPDHTGGLDALGHLLGTQDLLMAMLEDDDETLAAIKRINAGWQKANNAFHELLLPYNNGHTAHAWMHLLAPGRLQHMQADISVMISPQMYEKFVLPELHAQMQWIDYPVYHFDGAEQIAHLDMLLSLEKLKAIQWTAVAGQPSAKHYLPALQKMQAAGKALIIMTPPEDVEELLDGLSHKGLYLHTEAKTPEEADALVKLCEQKAKP